MTACNERYYTLNKVSPAGLFLIEKTLKQFRKDYDIREYPLDCFTLLRQIVISGKIRLGVLTSDDLSSGFEAATSYLPEINEYCIILPNVPQDWKERSSWRRCNFTVAHELGHILLGHLQLPLKVKSQELGIAENDEADEFAGRLLMPEKLILKSNCSSRAELAKAYLVSESACFVRLNNLRRLDLLGQPGKVICPVCGNGRVSPVAEYCEICGTKLTSAGSTGVREIDYPMTLTDESNRVLYCPRCGNEEFSASAVYCRICGLPVRNTCGSNKGCHHVNASNARYCELCGAKTVYRILNMFPFWLMERDEFIRSQTQE